jgi:hypothetical protein
MALTHGPHLGGVGSLGCRVLLGQPGLADAQGLIVSTQYFVTRTGVT